jgi:hypothetical protein
MVPEFFPAKSRTTKRKGFQTSLLGTSLLDRRHSIAWSSHTYAELPVYCSCIWVLGHSSSLSRARLLIRPYMLPLAWVLGLREATTHACCVSQHPACAVQALGGCRGVWTLGTVSGQRRFQGVKIQCPSHSTAGLHTGSGWPSAKSRSTRSCTCTISMCPQLCRWAQAAR